MDEDFLNEVYRTTIYIALIFIAITLSMQQWMWLVGLIVGTVIGLGVVKAVEFFVKLLFTSRKKALIAVPLVFGKYILIGISLYVLIRLTDINLIAVTIGFSFIYLVIFLKAVGQFILQNTEREV